MNTFLRHANEYYDMLSIYDDLYKRSQENNLDGVDLYNIITSKDNILLAYRSIKSNTGSKTKGTDNLTIGDYKIINEDVFVKNIQDSFANYQPGSVRRVEIPKDNGKSRPLGIPTMRDRLMQQCVKQVVEPICEAKFYNHSYGFRPNRSTHNAMARCQHIINRTKLYHVVDIDIKGFFDNVNHTRLIKQCYNIGIKDIRVLSIVWKMLKAPIGGEGVPTRGTPQGGILSPLLSNIVLNDLDWWISSQWENMQTTYTYSRQCTKVRSLKTTKLKNMYIVRYADDFKIFTDTHKNATKIYHAVKGYLNNHLKLEISTEKSKITNLRRKKSEFLGFSIKATKKMKKNVAHTFVSDKKKEKIQQELKRRVKAIQKKPVSKSILGYNSYVLGIHNYYRIATHVNTDFSEIAYRLTKTLHNRLKSIGKYGVPLNANEPYKKFYKNNYKTRNINGTNLYPIADIQTKNAMNFTQGKCNYTINGRSLLEAKYLEDKITRQINILRNSVTTYSAIEYIDNRISKYSMQRGNCSVAKKFLPVEEIHCHHIIPIALGGSDKFDNLVIVHKDVHVLIHATDLITIKRYMDKLQLIDSELNKINTYRKKCNLGEIK